MLNIKNFIRNNKNKKLIEKSNLFNAKYYLKLYRDARLANETPFHHFCKVGLKNDWKPNENFDPIWYKSFYADVNNSNIMPLIHFIKFGILENRFQNEKEQILYNFIQKNNYFDEKFYKNNYSDLKVQDDDFDFLLHFIRYGDKEHRKPNKTFDPKIYIENYNDVKIFNINPFEHYILYGKKEGRALINQIKSSTPKNINTTKNKNIFKQKNKLSICALIPGGIEKEESSSTIRIISPLTIDSIQDKVYFKALSNNFTFKEILEYDVCIVQRYAITDYKQAEDLIKFLKVNSIELVVDIDDPLGDTQRHKHSEYIQKLYKIIKLLLDNADSALFSTNNLIDFYDCTAKKKFVIPNALDPKLWRKRKLVEYTANEKIKFLYMGTRTHEEDFYNIIFPAFKKLHKQYPNKFELHVLGGVLSEQEEEWLTFLELPKKFMKYPSFIKILNELEGYHVGVAPLVDDDFNKCKSDIKFLDYLAMGILPMLSEVEAYNLAEHRRYGMIVDNSEWFENLETILKNPKIINDKLVNSQQYLWEKRSLEHISLSFLQTMEKSSTYIQKSGLFDKKYYLEEYNDIKKSSINPLWHYSNFGWEEDRFPSLSFDVLWYREEYLQNYSSMINPVLHYEMIGKKKGYLKKPKYKGLDKKVTLTENPKRVCLFAGYDVDGMVDDTVVVLIKELANYCDVYFLSDSEVSESELSKLEPYTKGLWAYRHGEYDFGSYKRLACEHVGWKKIEQYDELLFVNDSSYLISSLDKVFEKMDKKNTSWWGMQATKGIYATKDKKSNNFKEKISISDIKNKYLNKYFKEDEFDFLIGSYFLAFRKNIIKDVKFQKIINGIAKQRDKKTLILKYEIGLTKYLLANQYDFETYMDSLHPFHPIYTDEIYNMIKEGFPLFKRFFITENHYKQKELYKWKERLLSFYSKLDVDIIEKNILRVGDASKLYKNMDIEKNQQELLTSQEFMQLDKKSIVNKSIWIFPVCAYNYNFDDNVRAVFEEVKNDKEIKKVVLYRNKLIDVEGENVEIFPLYSREAQEYLLKSSRLFVKHSPTINIPFPLDWEKHKFINLWHGIPLKRIGVASLDMQNNLHSIINNHNKKCYSVIASSDIDRLAMSTSFYPLKYSDVWLTGLPRHDFILQDENKLSSHLKNELINIDKIIDSKKFILYAPTFRNTQDDSYFSFTEENKKELYGFLEKNDIMLGIREHMADTKHSYSTTLVHPLIFDAGSKIFENIEILYRKADMLVTDYSSCFIDYMLTNKPMISFAYDYENYSEKERGTFYDLDFVFPGDICTSFDDLIKSLYKNCLNDFKSFDQAYDMKKKIFYKYNDSNNSRRLVEKVMNID